MQRYVAPSLRLAAFNCPSCEVYAKQDWKLADYKGRVKAPLNSPEYHFEGLTFAFCTSCKDYSLWRGATMIFPLGGAAPTPNPDLPNGVREIYEEARSIVSLSPKASAALLRLAIQHLTNDILKEDKGKKLDENIKKLVENGLPVTIQKSLDILRVIGNNAVHPGYIDFNEQDNTTIVLAMFNLVNIIVDHMITRPNNINKLYDSLPEDVRSAIKRRDKKD